MALTEKIIGAESGGQRFAKNPRSSAYGPGQFIASTWMSMIEKYRPDLAEGRSRAEILELRSDPKISREMTDAYSSENAAYLKSRGFEPTEQNSYLAHFAGPEGAAALLKNPDAPASSVLGSAAIEANPFLADWSSKQVIDWAGRKMGGKPSITAKSADTTGGMLDDALSATETTKGKGMDPFSMLMALVGGDAAAAASIGLGTQGSPTALNAATAGATAPQTTIAGDVARTAGYGETGGMLDDIFGGSTASLGGGSGQKADAGGDGGAGEAKAGNDMLAQVEKLDKQMLAAIMQPQNPNVDMRRLAQILQNRSSLGV